MASDCEDPAGFSAPNSTPGATRDRALQLGSFPKFDVVWHHLELTRLIEAVLASPIVSVVVDDSVPAGLVAVACRGNTHIVDLGLVRDVSALARALSATEVVTHDAAKVAAALGWCPADVGVFDVLLGSKLLDGGLHAQYPACFAIDALTGNLGVSVTLPPDLGKYGPIGRAAAALIGIKERLERQIQRAGLARVAELEAQLLPEVLAMQRAGVRIAQGPWSSIVDDRRAEAAVLEEQLKEGLGISNPRSQDELLFGLHRAGVQAEDSKNETLTAWKGNPLVQVLLRFRKLDGFISSVANPISKALKESPDGRVRAHFDQIGCATGRMTCYQPNLFGLPREKAVRNCVVPDAGFTFVEGDYAAAELRVLAELAGDSRLLDIFANGADPHRITASTMTRKPLNEVSPEERQAAKAINFGSAYAMGGATMAEYAAATCGVPMTIEDATTYMAAFKATYPGIAAWQESTRSEMPDETRTLYGRVRRYGLQDGFPARLASPVQGTVADATKLAMVLAGPNLRAIGGRIVLSVHDQLLAEVPCGQEEVGARIVAECMHAAFSTVAKTAPARVDASVRASWGG